jgi:hypothetical protein
MTTALERQVLAPPLIAYAQTNNIPVDWPNVSFDKPATGPWIRFTVIEKLAKQIEMGSGHNTERIYGSLILSFFAPAAQGDGPWLAMCDALGALYRQKVFNFTDTPSSGHVRMRNPVVTTVGRTTASDAYFLFNVTIPFHRDDLP